MGVESLLKAGRDKLLGFKGIFKKNFEKGEKCALQVGCSGLIIA